MRLLGFEFKSDNTIKSKALNFVVKADHKPIILSYFTSYKTQWKRIASVIKQIQH